MFEKRQLAWLLLLVLLVPGCVRAKAKTLPNGPPLDVPAPPPRIVVPLQAEAPPAEPIPAPEEPRRPPTPVPARPRPTTAAPAPTTVETPPVTQEPPKPASTPPATALQTTPAAEQGEVERAIRATMIRASADLKRVDYRALNANARTQYDTAKRFIQQAEDAIRMKNLPFAKNLADKAAALAAQLRPQ